MFQYAVVEFVGGSKREVDIVCMSWLIGDGEKTLWPPTDVTNKQKKQVPPEVGWKEFKIKIIARAGAVLKSIGKDEKITLDKIADAAKVWLKSAKFREKNNTEEPQDEND